jgi:hypothetical protein
MKKKASGKLPRTGDHGTVRTITLEEHYASPVFMDGPGRKLKEQAGMVERFNGGNLIEKLTDLGEKRIAEMDAAGIDVQVLSLTDPSVQQLDATGAVGLADEANDYLAETGCIFTSIPENTGRGACRSP